MYICYSPEVWEEWYEQADSYDCNGSQLIKAKLQIVKDYMSLSWGIDLDKLRATVQAREANVAAGKIDLTNIDVD